MESIGLELKNGRFLTHGSCASASEVHEWDMLISVLYPLERSAVVRSGQDPSRKFVNADMSCIISGVLSVLGNLLF